MLRPQAALPLLLLPLPPMSVPVPLSVLPRRAPLPLLPALLLALLPALSALLPPHVERVPPPYSLLSAPAVLH